MVLSGVGVEIIFSAPETRDTFRPCLVRQSPVANHEIERDGLPADCSLRAARKRGHCRRTSVAVVRKYLSAYMTTKMGPRWRVFSPDEAASFLEVADVMPHGLIFEFALLTGMRPEEYLALKWPEIDFEHAKAQVRRALVGHKKCCSFEEPKTARSRRTIFLPAPFCKSWPHISVIKPKLGLGSALQHGNLLIWFSVVIKARCIPFRI